MSQPGGLEGRTDASTQASPCGWWGDDRHRHGCVRPGCAGLSARAIGRDKREHGNLVRRARFDSGRRRGHVHAPARRVPIMSGTREVAVGLRVLPLRQLDKRRLRARTDLPPGAEQHRQNGCGLHVQPTGSSAGEVVLADSHGHRRQSGHNLERDRLIHEPEEGARVRKPWLRTHTGVHQRVVVLLLAGPTGSSSTREFAADEDLTRSRSNG